MVKLSFFNGGRNQAESNYSYICAYPKMRAQQMQAIQMVDLRTQYERIKTRVDRSIQEVIDSGAYINGPAVKSFEAHLASYLGAKHVTGCGNGTDALQIALMALNLQPGDEVITTPFTFVATAEVIALLGLKVVFVDIEAGTFNIDVSQIEAAITDRTRCIIPVHLFGQAADMEAIMSIAEKHNLYVVEDNAQAIGCEVQTSAGLKKTGTVGHIGCLSFYPSKNLGCYGDGGAVHTNDDELAARIKTIANHGSDRKYYYDNVGVNSRLDSIQAAILDIKLEHLDEYLQARRDLAQAYDEALGSIDGIGIPERNSYSKHVFHQYTLRVQQRDALQQHLQQHQVPSMIYYPVPLHMSAPYQNDVNKEGAFPESEKAAKEVLSLPMHSEMSDEQAAYIIEQIKNFYSSSC